MQGRVDVVKLFSSKLKNHLYLLKSLLRCDEATLTMQVLLPTSQAFWKTRRPDEAADYRAVRRFVCAEKISQTLQNVEM